MPPTFHIRTASLAAGDDSKLLANFDSQLPWLESIGGVGQWGVEPRGEKESFQQKIRDKIERSETLMSQGYVYSSQWIRAYIIQAEIDRAEVNDEVKSLAEEVEDDGRIRVPVAGMILEAKSAEYVRSIVPEVDTEDPFIFLSYLLSDRRTSAINKGAGATLIKHGKDEIKKLGLKRFTGDCYAGNNRKLVQYYERQGFKSIGDFAVEEKDNWPGTVFEMRL